MIGMGGPKIGLTEKLAVWRQLSSGQLAQGQRVAKFETAFSQWVGSQTSIAVNSGTSALHIGLLAMGVGRGDEVIVPSFLFAASANAVALTGATPIFCDIDDDYFTIDVEKARSLVTSKTKAIMPVHLYGQMADMHAVQELAVEFGLLVLEDAAQAHGANLAGRGAGTWGDFGAFSFYPTKNMTTGEGGALTTSRPDLDRFSRLLRNQGMLERYKNEVVGLNNRMTEVQAAIGIVQLGRVDGLNSKRIKNASYLSQELMGIKGLKAPSVRKNSKHVFHQFTVLVDDGRDSLIEELKRFGVQSAVYYPTPVHRLESFGSNKELPVTDRVAASCLSLPVHPSLKTSDLRRVTSAIRQIFGQAS